MLDFDKMLDVDMWDCKVGEHTSVTQGVVRGEKDFHQHCFSA